jgi:putative NADH-flavin reductase
VPRKEQAMAVVLVIGASRGIGLETVRCALAAGHRVRALARGAGSIALEHAQLEKVAADALNRAAVTAALQGSDAVIETLGAPNDLRTVVWGTRLFSAATRILIDAMREKGVRRLVAVTGIGAGDSRGHGGFLYDTIAFPLMLKRVYDDKDVQEQMIRTSGLEWTIVRPGLLRSGPATGRARALTDPKEWTAASVARADVADFLVREAFERRFVGQTPLLIDRT